MRLFLKLQYIFNTRLSTVNRVFLSSTQKHYYYYLSSFTDTYRLFVLNSNRAYYYTGIKIDIQLERDGSEDLWNKNKRQQFLSHSPTPRDSHEDEIIFIVFNYELILFLYIIFSYSPASHTDNDININILNRKIRGVRSIHRETIKDVNVEMKK